MHLLSWASRGAVKFQPVSTSSPEDKDENAERSALSFEKHTGRRSRNCWCSISVILALVGFSITSVVVGFYAGLHHHAVAPNDPFDGLLAPPGNTSSHMIWNTTFANLPIEQKQWAWGTLFPIGEGHVRHPELAPDTSTIAVFHHLHCLQSIDSYIDSELTAQKEKRQHDHGDMGHGVYPIHIHYCFDMLRQALICSADTNLEPLDISLYGEHLAMPRKCRDINKVIEWAEEWKSPLVATGEVGNRLGIIRAAYEKAYSR